MFWAANGGAPLSGTAEDNMTGQFFDNNSQNIMQNMAGQDNDIYLMQQLS